MQNRINKLSEQDLQKRFERLARTERKITALVIECVSEINRRSLHLKWGYASLFDYLVRGMGYSESAAYRRIQATRAYNQIPEIKSALEDGSLKLSQVSLVQTALRREEAATGEKISVEARRDLFAEVSGKSGLATQRILDTHLVNQTEARPEVAHKRDESVEVTLKFSKEEFDELKRVKDLYSHIDPHADWVQVIKLMAKDVIKKRDPMSGSKIVPQVQTGKSAALNMDHKKAVAEDFVTQGFAVTEVKDVRVAPQGVPQGARQEEPMPNRRRAIPANVKRFVFKRDNGECQFQSMTGHRCKSQFQAQIDHVLPVRSGGGNNPENLRVLCRAHNSFRNISHEER